MKQTDLHWLAGLIEGEGSISKVAKSQHSWQLQIGMSDLDVLEKAGKLLDAKVYGHKYKLKQPHYKQQWRITIAHKDKLRRLLPTLIPLMGERRRAKMEEAMWDMENYTTQEMKRWEK